MYTKSIGLPILLCVFVLGNREAFAQGASATAYQDPNQDAAFSLTWQEAIKLIGAQDGDQAVAIEKSLREALRGPDRSEVIACGLVLHCVSMGNWDATKAALLGTRSVFPQLSVESKCFIARVRLWLWLTAEEAKERDYANSTFRELVTAVHRGDLPKSELRADAQLVGTVCGMLSHGLAESPIIADNLRIAEQCLLGSKFPEVKSQFNQGLKSATERAAAIERIHKQIEKRDPALVTEEQAERKAKLAELGYEFSSTRELMIEIVRNAREISRQNTIDRRKLADYVRKLNRDWMVPTEGHPGQPPIEPRLPQKNQIKVDEYETKFDGYETKTDANGNKYKVEKTERVRRSSSEINREREQKYADLMAQYRVLKGDFDRRMEIYVPLLNSWVEADRIRRQKMKDDRAVAEARSEELLAANKQLQEEASDAKSEFREQRSDVEILAEEYELTDITLAALSLGSISIAYRPPHFDVIDVEDEKFRLLGRIKK